MSETYVRPRHLGSDDLRLPAADADDELERRLAAANLTGREDALAHLGALLPGLDLPQLAQTADGATVAVSDAGPSFASWFDGEDLLDALIGRHDSGPPRLKLMKDTRSVDSDSVLDQLRPGSLPTAIVPAGRLALALDRGHTVVLDGIDLKDSRLRRFSELVERALGCMININGYLSVRPHQSFGAHWDDHEVIIIHLLGRKRWKVHEPFALSPRNLLHDSHSTGPPMWEGVIGPGKVIHVPRGWGHDVTGVDELTFHLTVTIPRVGVLDLIQGSLALLHQLDASYALVDAALDAATPTGPDVAPLATVAVAEPALSAVRAAAAAKVRSRPTQRPSDVRAFLAAPAPSADVHVRAPHGGGVVLGPRVDGGVVLAFGRRAVTVADDIASMLAPLLDGRARGAVAVERATADPVVTRQAIKEAVEHGLLEVVADPASPGLVVVAD